MFLSCFISFFVLFSRHCRTHWNVWSLRARHVIPSLPVLLQQWKWSYGLQQRLKSICAVHNFNTDMHKVPEEFKQLEYAISVSHSEVSIDDAVFFSSFERCIVLPSNWPRHNQIAKLLGLKAIAHIYIYKDTYNKLREYFIYSIWIVCVRVYCVFASKSYHVRISSFVKKVPALSSNLDCKSYNATEQNKSAK